MTYLRAWCRGGLLLAVWWICAAALPARGAAGPVITLFDSLAEVTTDGALVVRETITARVPGGGHGMFRDIPCAVRLPSGRVVDAPPKVLAIAMDGVARPLDDVARPKRGVYRIFMRDTGRTMAPGVHTFMVRYVMRHMVGFFDDHDELNWNVTGTLWSVPIERARYRVRLPAGAEIGRMAAWLGPKGGRESPVTMGKDHEAGATVAFFASQRAIRPGEGLTCAVSWQKGLVQPPSEDAGAAVHGTRGAAAAKALAALTWAYFFLVWWRYGRDPARGTIIPRFYPPQAPARTGLPADTPLSPAAVNALMHATTLESRGLAALLLSLAGRQACLFTGDEDQGFTAAVGSGTSPYPEEQTVRDDLARNGPLALDKRDGKRLVALRRRVKDQLARTYPGLWTFNTGWTLLGLLLAWGGTFGCLCLAMGWPSAWPETVTGVAMLGGVLGVGLPFAPLLFRRTTWSRRILFFLVLLLMTAGLGFGFVQGLPEFLYFIPLDMAIPLGLAMLSPWPYLSIMKAPSREARRLMDECEGLALYIRTAETERFRHFNPPERTPELYTRLLPYAVALHLEKAWGEHCAAVLEKARLEAEQTGRAVSHAVVVSSVANDIVRGTEQAVVSYEASRSSAFRSGGGGGGVGSGGGGGGGGFC